VTGILLVAASFVIPIVQRGSPAAAPRPDAAYCPVCGGRLDDGETEACRRCGARFRVEIE
jgi:hypothetical protein